MTSRYYKVVDKEIIKAIEDIWAVQKKSTKLAEEFAKKHGVGQIYLE